MKKFKCKNQYVSVMLLVLVLSAAWAACSGSRETAEPGESDSDKALAYMMKHIGQGVTYQLDLSHPLQHRYVTDTLNDAGFDEKNSPQSFAQLAATGNKKKGSKPDDPKPAQRMPGLELAPINYISNLSVKGGEFSLTGLSTMPRGAPQTIRTHVLITLLDQKGRVLTRESSDRFHANRSGTYVSFNIRGKIPGNNIPGNKSTKENEMLTANALFLIYPQDSAQPTAAYSKITDEIIIPDDACLQEPTYKADQTDLPCTNDIDNTTPITVCWSRLSESECDYWHDGTNHPETYEFPVKGSMTFASRIDTSSSATGFGTLDITLTAVDSGGGCQLEPGSGSGSGAFPAGFTVGGDNGNVLSWELPEETFDKTDPSCQYSGTYLTNFTMAIAVNLTDGTTSGGTFTSDRNQTGDGIYYVPQIDFYEGCFAAGTKILMADGSSKEIEAFTGNGDERVKTGSGEILNVIGTTRGTEPLPMIRIKDEKGGDVLITDGHPVFTVSRGVVLAGNLKKGDIVKRIDGNAKITSITYEAYDGMVYNLRLGSLEGGGRDKTSLFANGILMGDNMMQRYYGRLDKQKDLNQKNVLERGLPKEWLKDYQHSESKKHE